ncbi:MAG: class I SAM-dependent methyltransferase [Candidatus Lokiarchaeota archaeon]|nr:class I SAM-dependent methyltransferase [Candidatus Lokiarchaeota archaeon]
MDEYQELSIDYDILNPKEVIFQQKDFFKKLIEEFSIKSCLDCACGTGWHLFMLDELGLNCFGSDLSPSMLLIAKKNLLSKQIPLKLVDFRRLSYSWEMKFDMIICMSTSLPHMLTEVDIIAALDSMFRQLNENGILIISNGISDSLLIEKPKLIPARILKEQAFYFFMEYPTSERVIFNILNIKKIKNGFQHGFAFIENNAMKKVDVEKYLTKIPFKKINYYGNYDFSPYSVKSSKRLIIIAQK